MPTCTNVCRALKIVCVKQCAYSSFIRCHLDETVHHIVFQIGRQLYENHLIDSHHYGVTTLCETTHVFLLRRSMLKGKASKKTEGEQSEVMRDNLRRSLRPLAPEAVLVLGFPGMLQKTRNTVVRAA